MLKFYLSFIPEMWTLVARWRGQLILGFQVVLGLAVVFYGIFYFNDEFLRRIIHSYDAISPAISPAWLLLPIFLGFFYAFLLLNYERHLAQDKITSNLRELIASSKSASLTFRPRIFHDKIVTPQGSKLGSALVAEIIITNTSKQSVMVIPKMRYHDTMSDRVFKLTGRWYDSQFLADRNHAPTPVTLTAGESRRLAVAVQFNNDTVWYGVDNASPFDAYKTPRYKLVGPSVNVDLTIKGDVDITQRFQIQDASTNPKFD
jgi:hypothetical protein